MFFVAATGITGQTEPAATAAFSAALTSSCGKFRALQVLLEQSVVGFGHPVDQGLPGLGRRFGQIVRDGPFRALARRARIRCTPSW